MGGGRLSVYIQRVVHMRKSVFLAILVIFLSLWMSCENNGQSPATETEAAAVAAELKAHELIQNAIKEESDESIKVNFILPDAKAIGEEILSAEVTFSGYRHGTVLIESGMLVYRFYGYSSSSRYIYPQSYSVETINALQVRSESVGKAVDVVLSVPEDLNADVDGYISTDGGYKLSNNFMLYIPYGCSGTIDGNPFYIEEVRKPVVVVDRREIESVKAFVDVRKGETDLPTSATAFITYDDNTEEERTVTLNETLDVSSSGIFEDKYTITIDGKSYPVEVFVYDYTIDELRALLDKNLTEIHNIVNDMIAWISQPDEVKYVYIHDGTEMVSVGIPSQITIQSNSSVDLKNLYFRGENADATVNVVSKNNPSFLEVAASGVTFDGLNLDFTGATEIDGKKYNAIIIGAIGGETVSSVTSNLTVKNCSIIGAGKVAFGISIPEYGSNVSISNVEITGCGTSLILRNDTSLEKVSVDSGISIIVSEPDKLNSIEFKDVAALANGITVTVTAPKSMEDDVDLWIEESEANAPSFVYDRKLQEDLDIGGAEITPWEDGGSFDVEAGM